MPELLDAWPSSQATPKYPFDRYADGRPHLWLYGTDYSTTARSFRSQVKKWADNNGYAVRTRIVPGTARKNAREKGVAVQLTPKATDTTPQPPKHHSSPHDTNQDDSQPHGHHPY